MRESQILDNEGTRIPKSGQPIRKQIKSRLNTEGIKMAKEFTPEEIEILRKNPNTWSVNKLRISLTKINANRLSEGLYMNASYSKFYVTEETANSSVFTSKPGGGLNALNSNFIYNLH